MKPYSNEELETLIGQTLTDESLEWSVIGWMINNPYEADRHLARLKIDDFTDIQSRGIIEVMLEEFAEHGRPDERKLINILRKREVFDDWDDFTGYKKNAVKDIEWGMKHIKDLSSRRTLAHHLLQENEHVFDLDKETEGILNRLGELPELLLRDSKSASLTFAQVGVEYKDQGEPEILRIEDPRFEKFYDNGCRKGFVEGVLGRTGHGKTRYAQLRALQMLQQGYKVAWFQLEGDRFETYKEIMAIAKHMDLPEGWQENLYIQDSHYVLSDIMREIRILYYEQEIDAVIIDYLQDITAEGYRPSDVRQEKSYISKSLRRLAKELSVFMLWLLQPSRESKHDKGWSAQPRLSDIIETSQIEKDCYLVNGVFRPNMQPELVRGEHQVQWYDHTEMNPSLQPYHSVVIQNLKNRKSSRKRAVLHLIDSANGLRPYEEAEEEREKIESYTGTQKEDFSPFDFDNMPDLEEEAPF